MTKADLTFKADFKFVATRNDCEYAPSPFSSDAILTVFAPAADVHAFLGWFDCAFRACHKPVSFSTGPHAKYTHWKRESPPFEPFTPAEN